MARPGGQQALKTVQLVLQGEGAVGAPAPRLGRAVAIEPGAAAAAQPTAQQPVGEGCSRGCSALGGGARGVVQVPGHIAIGRPGGRRLAGVSGVGGDAGRLLHDPTLGGRGGWPVRGGPSGRFGHRRRQAQPPAVDPRIGFHGMGHRNGHWAAMQRASSSGGLPTGRHPRRPLCHSLLLRPAAAILSRAPWPLPPCPWRPARSPSAPMAGAASSGWTSRWSGCCRWRRRRLGSWRPRHRRGSAAARWCSATTAASWRRSWRRRSRRRCAAPIWSRCSPTAPPPPPPPAGRWWNAAPSGPW